MNYFQAMLARRKEEAGAGAGRAELGEEEERLPVIS